MRNTKQKSLILEIINNSYNHPTASEIYIMSREVIPNISLGTVYRALNDLTARGMIKRIKMGNNIDRYDRVNDFHPHFLCLNCHKVYDLKNDFQEVLNKTDHLVIDYEINLRGVCHDCRKDV